MVTMREVPVLARKLHHPTYMVRPGRCFVRRLLQLGGRRLNGEKLARGGSVKGRIKKKAETERVIRLTLEVIADVAYW